MAESLYRFKFNFTNNIRMYVARMIVKGGETIVEWRVGSQRWLQWRGRERSIFDLEKHGKKKKKKKKETTITTTIKSNGKNIDEIDPFLRDMDNA